MLGLRFIKGVLEFSNIDWKSKINHISKYMDIPIYFPVTTSHRKDIITLVCSKFL